MTRNPLITILFILFLRQQLGGNNYNYGGPGGVQGGFPLLGTSALWLESLTDTMGQMTGLLNRINSLSGVGNDLSNIVNSFSSHGSNEHSSAANQHTSAPSQHGSKTDASAPAIDMEKLMEMAAPLLNSFSKQ